MDYLRDETLICKMSRALDNVADLRDVMSRLAAYASADISEEYIIELDDRAVTRQRLKR